MIKQNLHCHTTYDDGRNTPEEMVLAAEKAGLSSLGISVHAYIPGEDWTSTEESEKACIEEIYRLKEKYAGRIDVYCGLEYDVFGPKNFDSYEYFIGSGHVLGDHLYADSSCENAKLTQAHFGGADSTAERYFANCATLADIPEIDIVGHFDLLTKYDEQSHLYDPSSPRFRDAAYAAMEKLNAAGKIFEINTGAISRGYRTTPYPSPELLKHLHGLGGRLCICSDAHDAENVAGSFGMAEELAVSCGFKEYWVFDGEKFIPEKF